MLQNRSFNECMLVGKCATDLELRQTKKGVPVTNLMLVTQDVWKNRNTSEINHVDKWHKIVVWGKLAERVVKFAKKGMTLLIKGPISYRDHVTQDGNKTVITEIKAIKVQKIADPPKRKFGNDKVVKDNESDDEQYDSVSESEKYEEQYNAA